PRRFDARDVETLGSFARHAAIAIHNARRYAHERRRTARFELIARIASGLGSAHDLHATLQKAADAIHEVLDYPNVDIPLLDPADPSVLVVQVRGGSYKHAIPGTDRIPVARGIMGAAVRERRAQLVNDVARDPRYVTPPGVRAPRAELAVPIRLKDEVLGVVNVEGDHPFDELDLASLEVVADYLAVAISNARLIAQAQEAAVLAERHRLARELHDNVTQVLSSINLLAQTLVPVWRRDAEEGARRVARLTELTRTAFAEMRALLHELRPPDRETGISKGGRAYVGLERLREHALPGALTRLLAAMVPESLELRLDFAGYEPQQLELEEALFRVCQEAVSNAIRHARARRLYVSAAVHDAQVLLVVGDDGRGIARGSTPGIGMRSMEERVRAHGGELRVANRAPHGTQVEARLPRADRDAG
ncbi:MAG TPA: GAF domain-containing sensor histidine kinase, partial [Xanthomonadales bacterium]|nr:GAF domain-containing sensor histidine kinase [Xanthomonadales bacterium]